MAEALIDSLSTEFDPSSYRDEHREELLALIERKAEGKEVVASDAEPAKATKAPDLMAALEQSIAAVKDKKGAAKKSPAKSKTASKTASKAKATPKGKAKAKKAKSAKSKKAKASK